ncbi:hypothetical protein KHQ81_09930 [Mycoplasmatota bacterium]|nr:hypothetical protein KHQ81_09930 [Mycoplasmatota bacterium]
MSHISDYSVSEVKDIIDGEITYWPEGVKINGFMKSGYSFKEGSLYFLTQKIHDEDYLISHLSKYKIAGVVVEENTKIDSSKWQKASIGIIKVYDLYQAFYQMVKFVREAVEIPMIEIIGTIGKTTIKEMMKSILQEELICLTNRSQYNDISKMSYYLFKLESKHQACILETKIKQKGLLPFISDIIEPTIYVVTQIEHSQMHMYRDLKDNIKENQVLIIDSDNTTCPLDKVKGKVYRYGLQSDADIYATDIRYQDGKTMFKAHLDQVELNCCINTFGQYQVKNALCAILVGLLCGLSNESIIKGLGNYQQLKGHSECIKGINNSLIINDQYGSNILSVKGLLDEVSKIYTSKPIILILGDLDKTVNKNEKYQKIIHQEMGRYTKTIHYSYLVAIGQYADEVIKGALKTGAKKPLLYSFRTIDECIPYIKNFILNDSVVILKTYYHNLDIKKMLFKMIERP